MFLLYFLDTYINMVKCLQRVPFDVSINWFYLVLAASRGRKDLFRNIKNETIPEVSRATISRTMKKKIKTVWLAKEKYTKLLQEEMGNLFVKVVMVKAGIPPFISEETLRRVLQ